MNEDEAKLRIRLDIENRLKLDAYKEGVARLVAKARVETMLEQTASAASLISADGPSKGPADAPVTILEFSDFQCPYCKQAAVTLKPLLESYGENVRLIFKQMPLAIHADAFKAAQASVCASEQGKFWEFHDRLFRSTDLSESALNVYALELGLNIPEFTSCLTSEDSAAAVRKDMQEANRVDIQGTPTFFVNGRIVRGLKSTAEFKSVIEQALKDQPKKPKESPTR
jgi:protein-disulfide isomerase